MDAFLQRALAATLDDSLTAEDLTALALETGKYGVQGMALLDEANTSAYGNPEITHVNIGVGKNPGILVSGHDLRDLEMLLQQTQGTGVDVYTHSEMLPAHYYPAFKKYPNFVGNYGNAWWKQKEEFASFNGPILMTTNCIVPPQGQLQGPAVHHRRGGLSRLHPHPRRRWRGEGLLRPDRARQAVCPAGGDRDRRDRGRLRPRPGAGPGRQSRGGGEVRCHPQVRGDGRL